MLNSTTHTEYKTRFEALASDFTALADRTASVKAAHARHDFGQLTLQVARLLDSATDAGVFPAWHTMRETLATRIAAGMWPPIPTEPDARLCVLLIFAVSSWLARDYPDELLPNAAQLDWKHYRPGLWSIKSDAKGRLIKQSRPAIRDESPIGEPDGDKPDAKHRLIARSKNYADVCRLLGRLAQPTGTETAATTKRRPGRPPKQRDDQIDKVAKLIIHRGQDAGRTDWLGMIRQYKADLPKHCTKEKLRQRVKQHRNRQNKSANK